MRFIIKYIDKHWERKEFWKGIISGTLITIVMILAPKYFGAEVVETFSAFLLFGGLLYWFAFRSQRN